jgi:uncharacterized protein YlxW (UPF0749 family)
MKNKEKELDRLIDEMYEGEDDEYKSLMKDIVKGFEDFEEKKKELKNKISQKTEKIDDEKLMNDLLKVLTEYDDERMKKRKK